MPAPARINRNACREKNERYACGPVSVILAENFAEVVRKSGAKEVMVAFSSLVSALVVFSEDAGK